MNNPFFPNVNQGDSFELFIDTRDVKTSGYNTRFFVIIFSFFPKVSKGSKQGKLPTSAQR